jgi:putative Mn2+ efflux pump MntP
MSQTLTPSYSRYLLAYLLWAISVVLAILDLLVWRSSAMIALGMTPWDRYVEHAINQFGFLLLAILGLSVIVFTEHHYRTGVEENQLLPRFLRVTFIELLVLALAHLLRLVGEVVLGFFTPITLGIVLAEATLCAVVFWFYRRLTYHPKKLQ